MPLPTAFVYKNFYKFFLRSNSVNHTTKVKKKVWLETTVETIYVHVIWTGPQRINIIASIAISVTLHVNDI